MPWPNERQGTRLLGQKVIEVGVTFIHGFGLTYLSLVVLNSLNDFLGLQFGFDSNMLMKSLGIALGLAAADFLAGKGAGARTIIDFYRKLICS